MKSTVAIVGTLLITTFGFNSVATANDSLVDTIKQQNQQEILIATRKGKGKGKGKKTGGTSTNPNPNPPKPSSITNPSQPSSSSQDSTSLNGKHKEQDMDTKGYRPNKKTKEKAEVAIDGLQYADLARGSGSIHKSNNSTDPRIDVQGNTGTHQNIQVQVGKSTIAGVLIPDEYLNSNKPEEMEQVENTVKKVLKQSLQTTADGNPKMYTLGDKSF
ncbi:hypothetical protein [Pleurocapsa sp. PCC 7319]|uniref:hypothetical protein n=1 Tax=Pleurocapsa sp. PCC 7319 TaxID=118161 RepID=UPI000349B976|nr:hypothetical protein [Pleurocapsa sp. PCC 7319]